MRFSQLFIQTLRQSPGDTSSAGNQFLSRAGYILQVENGVFGWLPLAKRSLQKMENSVRQVLGCLNGQEINLPIIETEDPNKQQFLLSPFEFPPTKIMDEKYRNVFITQAPTKHLIELIQHSIRSHRQLPRLLYQFQPKLTNQNQSQNSVFEQRITDRLECFLLEKDLSENNPNLIKLVISFQQLLTKWQVPYEQITIDEHTPENTTKHEFYFIHPNGDESILYCPACGYQRNQKESHPLKTIQYEEDLQPVEEVFTPDAKTIEDLAKYLNIPASRTAKAVFLTATVFDRNEIKELVVIAIVRGDMELDENKLASAIRAHSLRPATEEEIISIGAVPGFASPVGLQKGFVVIDDLIPKSVNLVAGANKKDYHFKNVNYGRDFKANLISDITVAKQGDPCPNCSQPLKLKTAYLLAQMTDLGDHLSSSSGCYYQDEAGQQKPVQIAYAWMDYEKAFAGISESYNDKFGFIMPYHVSPFQVHLIVLPSKNSNQPLSTAEKIYQDLLRARIDVLYDDRQESPGVKFNDADLIGIPIRITVAEKSLNEGMVEVKLRHEGEKKLISLEELLPATMHTLLRLERDAAQKLAN